ncbi:hypothetical protein [Leifsonia xyli]|uniref:hypothetical protein n=1 Tax=Leifsonia xyli TaxID=1575 RepID=UPI000A4A7714
MTTTLALAARLRGMDDAVLTDTLRRRTYRRTGVADFFDLADALLDTDSLQRALAPLDRIHLGALLVLGRAVTPLTAAETAALLASEPATAQTAPEDVHTALRELADALLVQPAGDAAYGVYDAVTAQLDAWPSQGLPSPGDLLATPRRPRSRPCRTPNGASPTASRPSARSSRSPPSPSCWPSSAARARAGCRRAVWRCPP